LISTAYGLGNTRCRRCWWATEGITRPLRQRLIGERLTSMRAARAMIPPGSSCRESST